MSMTDISEIPDEEVGARYDEWVEKRIVAENAVESLRDTYVRLDTIADSNDLPQPIVAKLRDCQQRTERAAAACQEAAERADKRSDKLRQRLEELRTDS